MRRRSKVGERTATLSRSLSLEDLPSNFCRYYPNSTQIARVFVCSSVLILCVSSCRFASRALRADPEVVEAAAAQAPWARVYAANPQLRQLS